MTPQSRRVAVASDHAGFALKAELVAHLRAIGVGEVLDLGPESDGRVDYPDYAARVARAVQRGEVDAGVLICGTGIGMSMTANRFSGVRAALVHDAFTARMARNHNDAQILCLGARVLDADRARELVDLFFSEGFEGGRHAGRVARIDAAARDEEA